MASSVTRPAFSANPTGVRLQTLVLLRWLAVAGQLGAVLFVNYGLGFPLPLGFCLAAIAASAWLNVVLSIRYRATVRLPDHQAAAYLAYDLVQLAALLYLTGGLGNPFALLFMVPVTISGDSLALLYLLHDFARDHHVALSAATVDTGCAFGVAAYLSGGHLGGPLIGSRVRGHVRLAYRG